MLMVNVFAASWETFWGSWGLDDFYGGCDVSCALWDLRKMGARDVVRGYDDGYWCNSRCVNAAIECSVSCSWSWSLFGLWGVRGFEICRVLYDGQVQTSRAMLGCIWFDERSRHW